MYSGQTCTAPKRIFIHRSIYDDFLDAFVDRVEKLVVGDSEDERIDVSPVASGLAIEKIKMQLKDAVEKRAKVLTVGEVKGNSSFPPL